MHLSAECSLPTCLYSRSGIFHLKCFNIESTVQNKYSELQTSVLVAYLLVLRLQDFFCLLGMQVFNLTRAFMSLKLCCSCPLIQMSTLLDKNKNRKFPPTIENY